MKNISLFQLLGSFFIKFLFCPFISAHYNTLFGKSNQSYCDKNIFICVFYIKQYFYYVFIFFQLFFILFSDFCNADSSNEKNGTLASPATALANNVLPVPGGPTNNAPFGSLAPISVYLPGL